MSGAVHHLPPAGSASPAAGERGATTFAHASSHGTRAQRGLRASGYVLVGIAALVAPLVFDSIYNLNVIVTAAINVTLATGLAIVVRAGRLSLAQATFGGLGGYTSGILVMQAGWLYWPALLAAGALAGVVGVLLGLTSLKLRGFYFAIATFTFSQMVIVALSASGSLTGGQSGMFGLPNPPPVGPFSFADPRVYYYVAVLVAVLAILVRHLCTSGLRFGRALTVLGEDEVLAGALGIPATPYRLAAFGISSFIGGIGGSLYAHFIQGISPPDIAPSVSVFVLVMVMAGGSRSLLGPVIGAVLLTLIPEFLRASAQWSMVFYGVFLIAYVFLFRDGLVPLLDRAVGRLVAGAETPRTAARAIALEPQAKPAPQRMSGAKAQGGDILKLDGVTCAFGDNVVLKNLSLSLVAGEMRGLIGPNGAGKTTLFNLVTGLAPLTAGRVTFKDATLRPHPSVMARAGLSRTFQHPRILESRTVRENLALAAEFSGRPVSDAHLAWVADIAGLAPFIDDAGSRLSHYERRLLTIGMAVAGDPDLLLLDEPLAGLDDTETAFAKDRIKALHQALGCTVLLIEHKLSVVMELCSRLTVLDHGDIIADGPPAAVASDPAVIEAYLGS